ncbi:hypothetical protein [Paraburkholderia sp. PGU19]|uniref:hypothetical protein n=1 Tax=Paraburkholderia sp. PGU19 TaxID=2735434 RepID=UPI0015DBC499|nr:hypothetical protein [Paraburkholderia sp. PGU19]
MSLTQTAWFLAEESEALEGGGEPLVSEIDNINILVLNYLIPQTQHCQKSRIGNGKI